jgi:zona occludens toxin
MSITAIVGNPGAGKSYSAVHLCILPAIKARRPVFTNIPLRTDSIRAEIPESNGVDLTSVPAETLKPDEVAHLPGGTLIVLDEVWRYWPAEMKTPTAETESLFAEHRHKVGRIPGVDGLVSQDIVLLTQDMSDIPRFIRSRIAATFIVTKLTAVGAVNRFRVDRYTGAVSSMRPPKAKLVSSSYGEYTSDVWRYYVSHTKSDDTGGVDLSTVETGATANVSVWRHPTMLGVYLGLVLVVGFIGWRFFGTDRAFLGVTPEPSAAQESVPASAPVKPPPAPSALAQRAPVVEPQADPGSVPARYAGHWITGRVVVGESRAVLLFLTDGTRHVRVSVPRAACGGYPLSCDVGGGEIVSSDPIPSDTPSLLGAGISTSIAAVQSSPSLGSVTGAK